MEKRVVGELYNRMKGKRGGDHRSHIAQGTSSSASADGSNRQNDALLGKTSEIIGEKSGLSSRKVERSGARVEAEAKLTKAAKLMADKATDDEVKKWSQLESGDQDQVARLVRTGQAKTVKEALKGFKAPEAEKPKKPDKPPKKYDRPFWYKQWQQSIGPLCRLVDKIANDLGESKCQSQAVVQDHLNVATEEMCEWLGVKR